MDREALVENNLRLASFMAARQARKGSAYSLDELYSLCLEGLWNAARTYDPAETQFSTYACRCMENCIIRQYTKDNRQKYTAFESVSLNAKLMYGDKPGTRMDKIPSPHKGPEQSMMEAETAREVGRAMNNLTEKEREIVKMRFGIGEYAGRGMDWGTIGEKYGVTRQCAQQIGKHALGKMRMYLEGQRRAGREI